MAEWRVGEYPYYDYISPILQILSLIPFIPSAFIIPLLYTCIRCNIY